MKKIINRTLPDIEFDGMVVKPKNGVYKCPYKCGGNRYPQPTWKSEKGFRKHMEHCSLCTSVIKAKKDVEDIRKNEEISKITQKIGDVIYFVKEFIVKPVHVMRFGRMVKVRYEPVKRFESGTTKIESINWSPYNGVYFNNGILPYELCASIEEAKQKAEEKQKSWDEHVRFSEMCR